MQVKDLIEKLQKEDSEKEVLIVCDGGYRLKIIDFIENQYIDPTGSETSFDFKNVLHKTFNKKVLSIG